LTPSSIVPVHGENLPEKLASPKRAAVYTLGCKVNQSESAYLAQQLSDSGYTLTGPGPLELIIVNTCAVTLGAEKEALKLLRRLKRENPAATIITTGCLAQAAPDILAKTGLTTKVFGTSHKEDLAAFLQSPAGTVQTDLHFAPLKRLHFYSSKTRVFLKIQDGCSLKCSYCVIPSLRGPSRSLPLEDVLTGIKDYFSHGYPEIVLTGIHLGAWGQDLRPKENILTLLKQIELKLAPDPLQKRLRLSSLEPTETQGLTLAFKNYPWLAPHLHIPLQAGTDKILKLMRRPYTRDYYLKTLDTLRDQFPQMSLGADILVGFPGETETDFLATLDFLKSLPLSYGHVFPYSERPNTPAAALPLKVLNPVKKRRVQLVRELLAQKKLEFIKSLKGLKQLALLENSLHLQSKRPKVLTGNYLSGLLKPWEPGVNHRPSGLFWVTLAPPENPWGLAEAKLWEN
jgi:threonylcarbamoyladenosine tRNA methylthiotransferase MtaB